MTPIIFASTELLLVDLDCLFRTAGHLRAAVQVQQHFLSAELVPVNDDSGTEAMLSFYKVGRYAAKDAC